MALKRFQAKYLEAEVETDPFAKCPKDDNDDFSTESQNVSHAELLEIVEVEHVSRAPCIFHDALDARICYAGRDHQGIVMV
ncbi:hypothetical protein GW17_00057901 [Ensete ventricosum]|nr:hypothetical protein GW17_00057901 [Ensete ventricosum]